MSNQETPTNSSESTSLADRYAEDLRRGLPSGAEYAAAIGLIGSIIRPSRIGAHLADEERVTRVGCVLDALDRVLDEAQGIADIEHGAPRGTDEAEEHAPKPDGVGGYTHKRGQPFGVES